MSGFLLALALLLALVAGAWMRLAPGPEERRRARLRRQALAAGLRVRWIPPSEAQALGIPPGCIWYGLGAEDPARRDCAGSLAQDGSWQGDMPPADLAGAWPPGVFAWRASVQAVELAWNESAGNPEAVVRALQALAQAGQLTRRAPAHPPASADR